MILHTQQKAIGSHHPNGMILTVVFTTSFHPGIKQNLVGSIATPTTLIAMTVTTTTVARSATVQFMIVEATRWIPMFQAPTPTACLSPAIPQTVHSLEAAMLRVAMITPSKTCPIRIAISIPFRILLVRSPSLLLFLLLPPTRFLSGSSAA